jgi:hypothetical protein
MKYFKRIFSMAIMIACVLVVNISQAAEIKQEKIKACNLSYDMLLKAKPILEKGKPEDVVKLPDDLKSLDGKRVRIIGYLLVPSEAYDLNEPLNSFAVSQNAFGCPCCAWGPPPTAFNVVMVKVKAGGDVQLPYPPRIGVEGDFKIAPKYENGELIELYSISNATANSIY